MVPERLGNCYGEVTWGSLLVQLEFLDSRGPENPIGIGLEAQVSYGFQQFLYKKRGTQSFGSSSRRQGLKAKEYLGLRYWKVRRVTLSTDRGLVGLSAVQVEVWFCGPGFYEYTVCGFLGKSSTITTTATSTTTATATATAERLFETLRVYGSSTTTTTATSTATTTATAKTERLFEALRVYWLVIPSTDRGRVVLRFVRELGSFQQGRLYLLSIFP